MAGLSGTRYDDPRLHQDEATHMRRETGTVVLCHHSALSPRSLVGLFQMAEIVLGPDPTQTPQITKARGIWNLETRDVHQVS